MSLLSATIHVLPPQVANQIAAGEVVERPASAMKELIENSLDAGAGRIVVRIEGAGKKRIEVEDDGCGMSAVDARLSLQRHATSKIASAEDLHRIASHGFRGEALPSIASVSRLRLHTCLAGAPEGVELRADGGCEPELRPAPPRQGTRIEVLDLFLNTPARLRFMRTDRTEEAVLLETFRSLALAHPRVAMRLEVDGRQRLDFPPQSDHQRVLAIMGDEFGRNMVFQQLEHEGIQISAWLGLPTFHHRDASRLFFLLNGRVIRDRQLLAAIRAAYRDVMFHDRYPLAVVRLEMDPVEVDVNVHPAKREVRFRKPQRVRTALASCVRAGIERMGQRVSSRPATAVLERRRPQSSGFSRKPFAAARRNSSPPGSYQVERQTDDRVQQLLWSAPKVAEETASYETDTGLDLGMPLAQIHRCYILAQTADGIVLIDQHAAHERMTYERLKRQLAEGVIREQPLLTPEIWHPEAQLSAWLHEHAGELACFGMRISNCGDERYAIDSVPALLAGEPPLELAEELARTCMLLGIEAETEAGGMGRVLERWLGNRACKGSIKSGRLLSHEEQVALLRGMEQTPNIGQCNHGRPTYIRLSLDDLDRLFGRRD